MTLIKTSLLNSIAVIIKMLTLLGINKVLAIYVGPSGYAAIGQFQNAVQMISTVASGAINTGVIKYTSEYYNDQEKQHAVWRTAGTVSLIGSVSVALIIIAYNRALAQWFLKNDELGSVFIWFAGTLVLFVFNTLLLAILNGKKEVPRYVIANIAGSLFALIVTAFMTIRLGLYGALVALAIYQSLAFFVTLTLTYKTTWFKFRFLIGKVDLQAAKNLAKYTAMALTGAACVPLSHILIRNHIGETIGWDAAGYWEAMWRLSAAYLMLITSTLSVYYLPKLSELKSSTDIKNEILGGYKVILPAAVAFGSLIYYFRDLIISLLFSPEFAEMEVLFAWQIVGDTLKIGSWILSYLMLGKAMVKLFIATEIGSAALFYLLTIYFIDKYQLQGVAHAHALNYFIYWIVVALALSRLVKGRTITA